ncbi:MAG TPA: efflux RND transporter periplasmic adaptor subunit [Aliidongia sp.]|nr:efflux RND transporter periplasmic adaptor subunit [Aliidongia sp.]
MHALSWAAMGLVLSATGAWAQGVPTIPATTGKAEAKDVPVYVSGIGTVQAYNSVAVKSRTDGQITQVLFTEGQEVKAGDKLFQVDPRPYQAILDQAQAAKERDQGQLAGAQLDLDRFSKLLTTGYQTRQSYDDQKATVAQLQGAIKVDQAQIDAAKLNLEYTDIRAPIDGRTGARLVDQGNYIQAAQGTSLVSITQIKPIYVSFTLPQDTLDEIRRNQAQAPLPVDAFGSDLVTKLSDGHLTLIDNQIDPTTGTIHLKASFDNKDERLWPGEFVNARLILSVRHNAVTVPFQAVMQGAQGNYVYIVKPDDTVEHRAVQVLQSQDGIAVIGSGVAIGDPVVVEGQYRLFDGAKIRADTPQKTASSAG